MPEQERGFIKVRRGMPVGAVASCSSSQYFLNDAFSTKIISISSFVVPSRVKDCAVTAPCWEQGPVCIIANGSLIEDEIWCVHVLCNISEISPSSLVKAPADSAQDCLESWQLVVPAGRLFPTELGRVKIL